MSRWQGFDSNSVEMSKKLDRGTAESWASIMSRCGEDVIGVEVTFPEMTYSVWVRHQGKNYCFPDERHFSMWMRWGMAWFENKEWDFKRKKWRGIDHGKRRSDQSGAA